MRYITVDNLSFYYDKEPVLEHIHYFLNSGEFVTLTGENGAAVTRDVALLLKAEISHRQVVEAIQAAGVKRLTDIKLFDIFSGEKLGVGLKSMAYTLTFQNPEDSLTDDEVAKYMEKIQKSLEENVGAEVR